MHAVFMAEDWPQHFLFLGYKSQIQNAKISQFYKIFRRIVYKCVGVWERDQNIAFFLLCLVVLLVISCIWWTCYEERISV